MFCAVKTCFLYDSHFSISDYKVEETHAYALNPASGK